jgi:uncharacterized protein YfiM (DUF2279 family)
MANTTSGTYIFDKTYAIDDIITDAYERIGLVGSSGNQIRSARRSLNIIFQEWGNRGLHYWEVGKTNVTLTIGQAEYSFYRSSADGTSAPCVTDANVADASIYGFADIPQCSYRLYNNSSGGTQADTTMTKIDRSTYAGYGDKKTKSTPSNFWVQRFIDKITLTIYPTASTSAAGSTNKLHIYFTKRIEDAGVFTNASQVPYRFVPCMTAGLAFYLSQKFSPQRSQEMKLFYEDELARALAEDGSASSTFITPKTYYPAIT